MFCIYKILHNDTIIYIGSTRNLSSRIYAHYNNNLYLYKYCQENDILFENLSIETIDTYEDIEKQELLKREAFYIKKYTPPLNKNIPTRTMKEYRNQSEKYKEYHRTYYKKYMREYRAKNKL